MTADKAKDGARRPAADRAAARTAGSGAAATSGGATGGTAAGAEHPRRRTARGERRVEQLLDAAASVFGAVGYTSASTNAIAREARVSPGTLYQFFPNKETLAIELGDRLMTRLRQAHGAVFTTVDPTLPLRELLDTVLDPLIDFNCLNPVFLALMHGPEVPGTLVADHDALHAAMMTATTELMAQRAPQLSAEEHTRVATMTFALFKAGLEQVVGHQGAERDAYAAETKAAVYRYLAPLVETRTETGTDAGIDAGIQADAKAGAPAS
ncbi:TetR/AcrR family transcriptional regulator [Streptomyces sp. H27-D2]|uniref:TetR/AcrR family transcriptional regulator n=1 Tax=Streptomyces sp. H27-D2 TaxID=3046304 RepID=UPI002DB662B8|nr:TetR/AcrR family transcriptional regulator [Streptomyces sp. H27-D2]MEC4020099.1 TetR/AcrR family transcriptional regulator [Streptomyces sp. H27-D2]